MARCYRLADWTSDAGPEDKWLTRWAEAGWTPEHTNGGSWCLVNGRRLKRWSLTRDETTVSRGT